MEFTFRRTRRIAATAPICITLLLSGCGGGGTLDLSSATNTGNACDSSAGYTPITPPVKAIAAAARISFAIENDDSLWAWGTSTTGQLGASETISSMNPIRIGDGFKTVSAGNGHSLGLKTDGTLWAWGNNSFGQLGNGSTTDSNVPIQIGSANDYTAISAGLYFSLALKSDGTLWAWGDNQSGELGIGNTSNNNCIASPTPHCTTPIQVGGDNDYIAISAGTAHALALKSDNSLWAWGDNTYGELGDGCSVDATSGQTVCTNKNIPEAIDSGTPYGYGAIAAGYLYSLAIKNDGTLWAWGNNAQADLGTGDSTATYLVPTQIGDGFSPNASALSASKFSVLGNTTIYYHSLALKSDGSLWAWGDNFFGQLGDGTRTPTSIPEQILASSGYAFTAVSAGDDDHSLAIKNDGSLWAWGRNSCGDLGDGTTDTRYVPIQVSK